MYFDKCKYTVGEVLNNLILYIGHSIRNIHYKKSWRKKILFLNLNAETYGGHVKLWDTHIFMIEFICISALKFQALSQTNLYMLYRIVSEWIYLIQVAFSYWSHVPDCITWFCKSYKKYLINFSVNCSAQNHRMHTSRS